MRVSMPEALLLIEVACLAAMLSMPNCRQMVKGNENGGYRIDEKSSIAGTEEYDPPMDGDTPIEGDIPGLDADGFGKTEREAKGCKCTESPLYPLSLLFLLFCVIRSVRTFSSRPRRRH